MRDRLATIHLLPLAHDRVDGHARFVIGAPRESAAPADVSAEFRFLVNWFLLFPRVALAGAQLCILSRRRGGFGQFLVGVSVGGGGVLRRDHRPMPHRAGDAEPHLSGLLGVLCVQRGENAGFERWMGGQRGDGFGAHPGDSKTPELGGIRDAELHLPEGDDRVGVSEAPVRIYLDQLRAGMGQQDDRAGANG